jgi:hypothetical protein
LSSWSGKEGACTGDRDGGTTINCPAFDVWDSSLTISEGKLAGGVKCGATPFYKATRYSFGRA